jgi:hypothetical protein
MALELWKSVLLLKNTGVFCARTNKRANIFYYGRKTNEYLQIREGIIYTPSYIIEFQFKFEKISVEILYAKRLFTPHNYRKKKR